MADKFHNAPPLKSRLELTYEHLAAEAVEAAAMVPAELAPIAAEDVAGGFAFTAKALKDTTFKVEAFRKKEKEQILADGRTVDAFFAGLIEPVKAALDRLIAELNRYQTAKLAAQRAREEEERKAAELFEEPPPAPIPVREAARVVSMEGVKATASRRWVHTVTDPLAVPRNYLMVNEMAVKAAIAGGVREIPGVRIFEEIRTSIR